ncbi:hypothetical protein [Xanthomonas sp. NCPPB 2632]|uniref:hypothetical protein n=1 Tax=Xanthomonas sp. NCPPB 2632 TaxID=3240912 RepID=UPI003510FED2
MTSRNLLSQAITSRLDTLAVLREALAPRFADGQRLRACASELETVSALEIPADTATAYGAFADLVGIAASFVDWRQTVLQAGADAARHFASASARSTLWLDEYAGSAPVALRLLAEAIPSVQTSQDVAAWLDRLSRTVLPVVFYEKGAVGRGAPPVRDAVAQPRPKELEVAFLTFTIDDEAVQSTHYVTPMVQHDISIEVKVSRWPEHATSLRLSPISVEDPTTYTLTSFEFDRPVGDGPFALRQSGRALLKFAQSLSARPYEFKYSAQFFPPEVEQPVAVVGQRTLRLEGVDFARTPLTGFASLDRAILGLRAQLRQARGVTHDESINFLRIMTSLLSCSARSAHDDIFRDTASEAAFQTVLANELRRDAAIGADLEEHPHVGRGITDLSYKGVRIELKLEKTRQLKPSDLQAYVAQTRTYVAASGRRLGILCVLDASAKGAPITAPEALFQFDNDGTTCVAILVIQGNLTRPSDYSKGLTSK